jgi:hypothetical protein
MLKQVDRTITNVFYSAGTFMCSAIVKTQCQHFATACVLSHQSIPAARTRPQTLHSQFNSTQTMFVANKLVLFLWSD